MKSAGYWICFLIGPGLLAWAVYQFYVGQVYAHTGWTKLSRSDWMSREDRPFKFWSTIIAQLVGGIALIIVGIAALLEG